MDMNVPFFGRGMMMFFKGKMDAMLGGDFEKGLGKLKTVSESGKEGMAKKYDIQEMDWTERTYAASKKTNLAMDKIQPFFAENFPKLFADVQKDKIAPQSAPSAIYYSWDEKTMSGDMVAAVGIPNGTKVKGWETIVVPAGKVLFVSYYGPYRQIGDAHMAIGNYIKEKNLTKGDMVVEEYITDPGAEKDSTKWQTNIYYSLK
jgi:effector-binding domain-containing protein